MFHFIRYIYGKICPAIFLPQMICSLNMREFMSTKELEKNEYMETVKTIKYSKNLRAQTEDI